MNQKVKCTKIYIFLVLLRKNCIDDTAQLLQSVDGHEVNEQCNEHNSESYTQQELLNGNRTHNNTEDLKCTDSATDTVELPDIPTFNDNRPLTKREKAIIKQKKKDVSKQKRYT
eukprot:397403_1